MSEKPELNPEDKPELTPRELSKGEEILTTIGDRGLMIATAESLTGGLIISKLTDVEGCSNCVDRGFVTYSSEAKQEMLGVKEETLKAHGAVSEEVAAEMASGALERSRADVAIAVTGIAGPGTVEGKPEGRVCFGLADHNGVRTETVDFGALGRDQVRAETVNHALNMLLEAVK